MPTINTITELEELYASPVSTSLAKVSPVITPEYQQLIDASPFCLVSSSGPEGLDCSPRGDGTGFVHVIDSRTLALPDRRGNNRLDTIRNIVRTGQMTRSVVNDFDAATYDAELPSRQQKTLY